jgi:hypothetical protein
VFCVEQAKETKNKIAEYVLCCIQCCLWCLENCMKFVNKNAYIQVPCILVHGLSWSLRPD